MTRTVHAPPPDGINVADPAASLTVNDAMRLINLLRGEFGLQPRMGYREWVTGLGGEVRTVIPYTGSSKDGSQDKLFACTPDGIWDVSDSATEANDPESGKVPVFEFSQTTGLSGWGVFTTYDTIAGKYILYTDEVNGLVLYTESTGEWTAVEEGTGAGQISGVDPGDLNFVMVWKNRIWFVEGSSARAWYLPIGQITGTAQCIEFGNRLPRGGQLIGLWDWTVDGGQGIDSFLVGISTSGDVLIYQGTDPENASTFSVRGTWSCGSVPAGRRIATDIGGDLLIVTSIGILPLSKLVQGGEKLDPTIYSTRKVHSLLNAMMQRRRTEWGWSIRLQPADNAMIVLIPYLAGQPYEQLAMAMATKGWSTYQGLPMLSAEVWHGQLWFGTLDGRVCVNDGYTDNVDTTGANGTAIVWQMISSFQELGEDKNKIIHLIRPDFLTTGEAPSYSMRARFDFDMSNLPAILPGIQPSKDSWDTGIWGEAKWGGGIGTAGNWTGTTGVGHHVALEMNGSSIAKTIYIGASITWETGGVM